MTTVALDPAPPHSDALAQSQRPPIATAALSVILPACNVGPTVKTVLHSWIAYLDSLQRDYEIILVDDGSTDGTATEAEALAQDKPNLHVLKHSQQRGFGAALRTGLAAAKQPLLCYAACDPLYRPAELAKLLEGIDQVDLVSGYRGGRPMPTPLRVAGFLWRCLVRVLFGIPLPPSQGWLGAQLEAYQLLIRIGYGVRIHDIDSPFKLFRRSIFARLPLQSDGHFVHAEILAKATFLGCLLNDEPVLDVAATWQADPKRWTEARQVFRYPDFGSPAPRAQG